MTDIFVSEKKEQEKVKPPKVHKPEGKVEYKTQSFNPLSSFIYSPGKVNFLNKDPEEKVILILRRHPITNLKWILLGTLMLLVPLFLPYFPLFSSLPGNFQFVGVLIWYLVTLAFLIEQFISWFFNVNIVTDERVFDVDFINLVYREMTDANIEQIQDVTVKMGSPIRTVFNYGDIIIQTAAEIPQIIFEAVPKPDRVARILRELRVEEEQEKLEGRIR